jgi:effector-binding domain-containing protein
MISDQRVEERVDQPYAAIRTEVTMDGFGEILGPMWGEVFSWLGQRGIDPGGPPMIRYLVVDMARALQIDVGFPVAGPVAGDGRIIGEVLPGGRYASLTYTGEYGGLVGANAALQEWAAAQGLAFDQHATERGDAFGGRLESYLTDPATEPDQSRWETEVAYRLADSH